MSKNLDLKAAKVKLVQLKQRLSRHLSFIATVTVLVLYLFVVWQLNKLATAEPTLEQENSGLSARQIPRIDKDAINQIQSLEKNSPEVHSLFNEARNNPFHE